MESNLLDEDEEDDVAKVEGGEDGHEDGDADAEHHLQDQVALIQLIQSLGCSPPLCWPLPAAWGGPSQLGGILPVQMVIFNLWPSPSPLSTKAW